MKPMMMLLATVLLLPVMASQTNLVPSAMSPVVFRNTHPKAGAVLRAEICMSKYYAGPFEDKQEQYWNITVYTKNSDWSYGEDFSGYVRRDSRIGKRIFADVQDGKMHKCLVRIVPVKDPHGVDDDLVEITAYEPVTEPGRVGACVSVPRFSMCCQVSSRAISTGT